METNTENLKIVYVNPIGKNSNNLNEYEFFFSETPETVWARDWNISSPSACSELIPEESMYSLKKRLVTDINLFCAQENSCFSFMDVTDNILALAFEDLEGLDSYPEPIRLVFKYGETYENVVNQLSLRNANFIDE